MDATKKMCHDCPHRDQIENGTNTRIIYSYLEEKRCVDTIHRCHNAENLICVGSQIQKELKNAKTDVCRVPSS